MTEDEKHRLLNNSLLEARRISMALVRFFEKHQVSEPDAFLSMAMLMATMSVANERAGTPEGISVKDAKMLIDRLYLLLKDN